MTKPRVFELGDENSGIRLTYIKSRRVLAVQGWYDSSWGAIQGGEVTLEQLRELGLPIAAVPKRSKAGV